MPIIEPAAEVKDGTGTRIVSRSLGSPAAASTTAVRPALAVLASGGPQVVTTSITNPDVPRALTATTGGTAADIAAVQVTVTGTDASGAVITEALPAFTLNTATTVTGNRAFATVTSYSVPAMDGTGATVAIGTSEKLGIGAHLARNTVLAAYLGGAKEATDPTVATSATVLSANTVDLNSALNASEVVVDYYQS